MPDSLRHLAGGTTDSGGGKTPGMAAPLAVRAATATANPLGLIVVGGVKLHGEMTGSNTIEGAAKRTADVIAARVKAGAERQGWNLAGQTGAPDGGASGPPAVRIPGTGESPARHRRADGLMAGTRGAFRANSGGAVTPGRRRDSLPLRAERTASVHGAHVCVPQPAWLPPDHIVDHSVTS